MSLWCLRLKSGSKSRDFGFPRYLEPVCFVDFSDQFGVCPFLRGCLSFVGIEVEKDEFCRSILQARMDEGSLEACDIHEDVKGFEPKGEAAGADALSAGWPCQALSSDPVIVIVHSSV